MDWERQLLSWPGLEKGFARRTQRARRKEAFPSTASRRKRFFFVRRRDTLVFVSEIKKQGSHGEHRGRGERRHSQARHRGVSASSLCDGAIRFFKCRSRRVKTKGGSRDFVGFRSQPAGYPAITPHGRHRGVSALSLRDGAIRLCTCLGKGFSRRTLRVRRKSGKGQCTPRKGNMPN